MKIIRLPHPFDWLQDVIDMTIGQRRRRKQKLIRLGIREKPMGPAIGLKSSKVIAVNNAAAHAARDRQASCILFSKLPLELRLLIYEHALADHTLFIHPVYRSPLRREKLGYLFMGHNAALDDWKNNYQGERDFAQSSVWPGLELHDRNVVFDRKQQCGILSLALTCKAVFQEAHPFLYTANTFTFRDPYSVMYLSIRLPETHLHRIQRMYLHLDFYHRPAQFEVEEWKLWTQLWAAIHKFKGLHELYVNMVRCPPCPVDCWAMNTMWLEPLKEVTAPRIFKLLIPIDASTLQVPMGPSKCNVLGHPWVSNPEPATDSGHY